MKMLALTLDYYKKPLSTLLFEQDEEAEAEEPAEGEPEEEADEDEAEADEPAEGEATEGGVEDAGEPSDADSIDSELEALFIDFETEARKKVASESVKSLSLKMLLEEDNTEAIDLDHFSAEIARLVKNYENLLDMEKIIVSKASSFISDKYSDDVVRDFLDNLESQHDIEIDAAEEPPETNLGTPLAVGATSSGE